MVAVSVCRSSHQMKTSFRTVKPYENVIAKYDGHYKGWVQKRDKKKRNFIISYHPTYLTKVCRPCTVCELDAEIISFILPDKMYKQVRKSHLDWNIYKYLEKWWNGFWLRTIYYCLVTEKRKFLLVRVERWDDIFIRHFYLIINDKI